MDYLANLAPGPAELGSASIRTEGRGPEFLPGGSVQETEASVGKGGEKRVGIGLFLVEPELYVVHPSGSKPRLSSPPSWGRKATSRA